MKKKGISETVFGLTTIAAVITGYFLGKKEKKSDENAVRKGVAKSLAKIESRDQIIDLKIARGYHCEFLKYINGLRTLEDYEKFKELVRHPINIDNAKCDFEQIFAQPGIVGLRMYPGLKKNECGENEFTLIFIGTTCDQSDLIEVVGGLD